jgi:hypothetical protein
MVFATSRPEVVALARRLTPGSADEAFCAVVEDLSAQFSSDPAFGRVTDVVVSRGDRSRRRGSRPADGRP